MAAMLPHAVVIYPMTKVSGLQFTWNNKVSASGLMTEARQD
jgi:hypothetical protein